jgi:hypothetical protein
MMFSYEDNPLRCEPVEDVLQGHHLPVGDIIKLQDVPGKDRYS